MAVAGRVAQCALQALRRPLGGAGGARFSHDDSLLPTCGGRDLAGAVAARHRGVRGAREHRDARRRVPRRGGRAAARTTGRGRRLCAGRAAAAPRPHARRADPSVAPPFLEASSLSQAARVGAELAAAAPSEPSLLGALAASTALMAIDEPVQKQSTASARGSRARSADGRGGLPAASERAPLERLELTWAHGVRAHDARGALHVLRQTGEVVYPSAALVVLQSGGGGGDGAPPAQRFYRGHTSAVLALAAHPEHPVIASGGAGAEPEVLVWDAASLQTLARLKGAHSGGLAAVAFSPSDGDLVASVDLAASPLLALWNWRRGEPWRPRAPAASASSGWPSRRTALITHGVGSLRYWTAEGARLTSRRGLTAAPCPTAARASQGGARRAILCVAFSADGESGNCGTADGCIQQWDAYGQCTSVTPVNRRQPILLLPGRVGVLAAGKGGRLFEVARDAPRRRAARGGRRACPRPLARPARSPTARAARVPDRPSAVRARLGRRPRRVATRGGEVIELPLPWDTPPPPGALAAADGAVVAPPCCSRRATRRPARRRRRERARGRSDADRYVTGGSDGTVRVSIAAAAMSQMKHCPPPSPPSRTPPTARASRRSLVRRHLRPTRRYARRRPRLQPRPRRPRRAAAGRRRSRRRRQSRSP